jgi:hypothetical protein
VIQFQADVAKKAAGLAQRKTVRDARAGVMADWNKEEEHRKEVNAVIGELWAEAVTEWEAERDAASVVKRKPGWAKLVLKGALIPPIPKPTRPVVVGTGEPKDTEESDSSSESEGST